MKNDNSIPFILLATFVSVLLIIIIPTIYKVIKENQDKKALANEKLIIEKAEKCIYESKCTSSVVTLKTLYNLNYLEDEIINPYNKTIYSTDSYVVVTKEGSTLHLK